MVVVDLSNDHSVEMLSSGALSAVGSLAIISTYLLFNEAREHRYIELVFYVSLSDLMGSIGAALGFERTGTFPCWFQAIVTNYFFLTSAFWCVVIAYQVYLLVYDGETIKNLTNFHLFCWIFPAVVTLLPLTTNTYGLLDDDGNDTWCFISATSKSPSWGILLWDILSFYGWMLLSVLIILVFYAFIVIRLRSQQNQRLLWKLGRIFFYPITLIICWSISGLNDLSRRHAVTITDSVFQYVLPPLQGFFFALIFFVRNDLVSKLWMRLLCCQRRAPMIERESVIGLGPFLNSESRRTTSVKSSDPRSSVLSTNSNPRFVSESGESPFHDAEWQANSPISPHSGGSGGGGSSSSSSWGIGGPSPGPGRGSGQASASSTTRSRAGSLLSSQPHSRTMSPELSCSPSTAHSVSVSVSPASEHTLASHPHTSSTPSDSPSLIPAGLWPWPGPGSGLGSGSRAVPGPGPGSGLGSGSRAVPGPGPGPGPGSGLGSGSRAVPGPGPGLGPGLGAPLGLGLHPNTELDCQLIRGGSLDTSSTCNEVV